MIDINDLKAKFTKEQLETPVTLEVMLEYLFSILEGIESGTRNGVETVAKVTAQQLEMKIQAVLAVIYALNPGYKIQDLYAKAYDRIRECFEKEEQEDEE